MGESEEVQDEALKKEEKKKNMNIHLRESRNWQETNLKMRRQG